MRLLELQMNKRLETTPALDEALKNSVEELRGVAGAKFAAWLVSNRRRCATLCAWSRTT